MRQADSNYGKPYSYYEYRGYYFRDSISAARRKALEERMGCFRGLFVCLVTRVKKVFKKA